MTGRGSQAGAWTSVLVGREHALRQVTGALAARSALVVVEGEAGIGKTRLIREALATLGEAHGPVLLATCPAVPEPAPLGAVVAGVRRLMSRPGELSALGGALRPLFPEWADDLPPALEPLDEPSAVRHRLFRALSELLARRGVRIVVVEDVHWADSATLEWLLTSASDEPAGGSTIVVSYRPWDVPADSLLPRLTGRTYPGRTRVRVDLRPLDTRGGVRGHARAPPTSPRSVMVSTGASPSTPTVTCRPPRSSPDSRAWECRRSTSLAMVRRSGRAPYSGT